MPLLKLSAESIRQAAAAILDGDLAAFPTETVYGLGGDAYNPAALAKIFEAKGRPRFDPLIVHIAAVETLELICDLSALSDLMREKLAVLIKQFWPGPLTLVLPKKDIIPDLATSGLPTVAVRFPAHEAAQKLIALSTGAVAAPSANPFGYLSPTRAEHVADALGEKIEIILDGGPTQFGLESTVLDMSAEQPRLLRPGATSREAIEAAIGPLINGPVSGVAESAEPSSIVEASASIEAVASSKAAASPGLLKSHYAPRIPLITHNGETMCQVFDDGASAFLFFDSASCDKWLSAQKHLQEKTTLRDEPKTAAIAVLSETGNMLEAAARLFELLHKLERLKISKIHAQFAPDEGLGMAINDRLRRGSEK
jgi:L-threonylcarbamoyladenylate synthase